MREVNDKVILSLIIYLFIVELFTIQIRLWVLTVEFGI